VGMRSRQLEAVSTNGRRMLSSAIIARPQLTASGDLRVILRQREQLRMRSASHALRSAAPSDCAGIAGLAFDAALFVSS